MRGLAKRMRGLRERVRSFATFHYRGVTYTSEPADEQFALEDEFLGQAIVEAEEKFGLADQFAPPFRAIDAHAFDEFLARVVDAGPVELEIARHPANLRLASGSATAAAIDDPAQDTEIL